jgi:transposase-like protein
MNNWPNLITFLQYPKEIRRVIYTTHAIELAIANLEK